MAEFIHIYLILCNLVVTIALVVVVSRLFSAIRRAEQVDPAIVVDGLRRAEQADKES